MLAEKCVIRCVQKESFAGHKDERISRLCPYMDSERIIHLRTKILERMDLVDFGISAILPFSHPVVEMLLLRAHEKACHVGVQGLLILLREVLDTQRQENHPRHSHQMCCVQETWCWAYLYDNTGITGTARKGCCGV